MKMNKKGFTLIELLAIIVILAIIAVITVPIILNIIDNARKGAAKDSVIGYGKAVELAYVRYQYNQQLGIEEASTGDAISVTVDGTYDSALFAVDYDGTPVSCDGVGILNGKVYMIGCTVGTNETDVYSYEAGKAYLYGETGYMDSTAYSDLWVSSESAE